ncbi:MAG: PEP-CTERM sorting domain-containing protein [Verrucomicrobia bacterium]|nr:PEP-CTERM sorting domain-containing protein [Verrucomicrobiota bacterium]
MKKVITSIVALLLAVSAGAAVIATDNASDIAYNSGWTNGTSGGTGFGAWTLAAGGGNSGHLIGDSTDLAAPGADINVSGESFGMYGYSGEYADAWRYFSSDLSVGQTFSIELAVNWRNGAKGLNLLTSGGTEIINFNVGGDDYTMGGTSIGNGYSDNTEFLFEFTQTSAGAGTWSITRSGGITDLDTGVYTGVAGGFKLYCGGTDGDGATNRLYANNIQVVPEPATALLFGIGGMGAWMIRRNKKKTTEEEEA